MKDKKNVYVCVKCKHETVTVDLDEGTTPFMTPCTQRGCDGMAQSQFYKCDQDRTATHGWYRPTDRRFKNLNRATKQHVKLGGLILKELV